MFKTLAAALLAGDRSSGAAVNWSASHELGTAHRMDRDRVECGRRGGLRLQRRLPPRPLFCFCGRNHNLRHLEAIMIEHVFTSAVVALGLLILGLGSIFTILVLLKLRPGTAARVGTNRAKG